jgi:hypothetical protein
MFLKGLHRVLGALKHLAAGTKTFNSLAALILGVVVVAFSLALSSSIVGDLAKRFVGLRDSQVFALLVGGLATSAVLMLAFLILTYLANRKDRRLPVRREGSHEMRIVVVKAESGQPLTGDVEVEVGFENQERRSLILGKDGESSIRYPQNLEETLMTVVVTAGRPFRCTAPLRQDTALMVVVPEKPSVSESALGVLERVTGLRCTKRERARAFADIRAACASLGSDSLVLTECPPREIHDEVLGVLLPVIEGLDALGKDSAFCQRYWDFRQTIIRQCTPETHPSTWSAILAGLDRHITRNAMGAAKQAVIEEALLIPSRVSEDAYRGIPARFGTVYAKLLDNLAADPQSATSDVIRAVRHFSGDTVVLRQVFRSAVSLTLAAPEHLGEAMLELLRDLRERVFDLDEDIRRLLASPSFSHATHDQYERLLAGKVLAKNSHVPANGRVWQRKRVTWRSDVICTFANGSRPCQCQLDGGGELSLRGFYSPSCVQPFDTSMRGIALTVQKPRSPHPALRLSGVVGHVVGSHPPSSNSKGRGIRIDKLDETERKELFDYLDQIREPQQHRQ